MISRSSSAFVLSTANILLVRPRLVAAILALVFGVTALRQPSRPSPSSLPPTWRCLASVQLAALRRHGSTTQLRIHHKGVYFSAGMTPNYFLRVCLMLKFHCYYMKVFSWVGIYDIPAEADELPEKSRDSNWKKNYVHLASC